MESVTRFLFLILFITFAVNAGDIVLEQKDIMTAIKTEDIGTRRTRVVAWMNAQHEAGHKKCTLKGTIKIDQIKKPLTFEKSLNLFPGENVPLGLGIFRRGFDPSQRIKASVVCDDFKMTKKKRSKKTRNLLGTTIVQCCQVGPARVVCASPGDSVDIDISLEDLGYNQPICWPMEVPD